MSHPHARAASATLTPLGAAGTVTGSRYWLRSGQRNYLVDCGVFQGPDELEQLDWAPMPIAPRDLDAVILTHAHIDHTGYLPRLVADGFRGSVYATPATIALLRILLPDSAHIQEEQARYANKVGYARHLPARPLYTGEDAERALDRLRAIPFHERRALDETLEVTYRPAGHLLGSATAQLDVRAPDGDVRVVFSGDLGRYGQEVMRDPEAARAADYLVVESTYGDALHSPTPPEDILAEAVQHACAHRGALIVPSFAVGRAQHVLYYLRKLRDAGRIDDVPIFVDSPMTRDATDIYCSFGDELNLRPDVLSDDDSCALRAPGTRFVASVEESKKLNTRAGPLVVISANGMCTAGRIVHHLKHRLPDDRNVVLFVGYQGHGTRGRRLVDGARVVRIHGEEVDVRARIMVADGLSSHADRDELLRWMGGFERPPRLTLVTHGELEVSEAFAQTIRDRLGWRARVPRRLDEIRLPRRASAEANE